MKRIPRLLVRRLLFLVPQMLGVTVVTFTLVRMLPGDPAYLLAGPLANAEQIHEITQRLGLDKPIFVQFGIYLGNLVHGDLGFSWVTGTTVVSDLSRRVPATLELITIALAIVVVLGLAVGIVVSFRPGGVVDRIAFLYGLLAGAFPDYWLGLSLIFIFFFSAGIAPAPIGQLDPGIATPFPHTGFVLIDAAIERDATAFWSSLQHLLLPVLALVLVYTGAVMKMTRSTMQETLQSDFIGYARASGLGSWTITRYALRNSLPPIVTVVGLTYSFLLGSAVLVETVFSWGGIGQYAVQAVLSSDYNAVQGFVLAAALFNLVVFLAVDVLYLVIDPRIA